ncbi:recombinase family protein [Clostridium butyricum]|uniref:recombinase family protein n=1 Tax=Clostridium butyricum TaxID=1492 RepID=UPI002ABE8209|nr:recombinase family protein [Clostridium butyricum]
MKKVAIYSRKSKETDTGESIKNQIQFCKDYFIRKNDDQYEFEIFQDEGFSGGNINRPEFQRMILEAQQGNFNVIACYKVDRIGRNIIDFMNTFDTLQKNDVSLVSVTEGFDPNTPVGMMMMTLLAGFAEMERMNIAQRVKDNMQALAKLGRWSGGTPPTGYKAVRTQNGDKTCMYLEFIPEYRDVITKIYSLAANGSTTYEINKLTDIPQKTVLNIISNPAYCKSDQLSKKYLENIGFEVYGELTGNGYLPYNRRKRDKHGKKMFNAKGMFVAVSIHEAPIDSELWIKANSKIKQRGDECKPRISQYSFLAHLVKCKCGSGMYITTGHPSRKDGMRKYYFCCSKKKQGANCDSKRIRVDYIEQDVLELLKNFSLNADFLRAYVNNKTSKREDPEVLVKRYKKNINKLDSQLDNLTKNLSNLKGKAADKVIESMNNISVQIDKLNQKVFSLEHEKIMNTVDELNIDKMQKYIQRGLKVWDIIDITQKQNYMQNIIKEIKMLEDEEFKVILKV